MSFQSTPVFVSKLRDLYAIGFILKVHLKRVKSLKWRTDRLLKSMVSQTTAATVQRRWQDTLTLGLCGLL